MDADLRKPLGPTMTPWVSSNTELVCGEVAVFPLGGRSPVEAENPADRTGRDWHQDPTMTAIIVWAPIVAPWPDQTLRIIDTLIPEAQVAAAMRFRRWQDRQARLLARLALRQILQARHIDKTLHDVEIDARGRPFIREGGDFSITHTDTLAACAWVPRGRIGIDVETTRPGLSVEDMLPWMSDTERRRIARSPRPLAEALGLWTAKEAVCKADGCGLLTDVLPDCATPPVTFRGNVWRVATKHRHRQTVSLASPDVEPAIPCISRLRL